LRAWHARAQFFTKRSGPETRGERSATIKILVRVNLTLQLAALFINFTNPSQAKKIMDLACLAAAAFFLAGGACSIAYQVKLRNAEHFDYGLFTLLNPTYIQADWRHRRGLIPLEIASGFINAFAWLLLAMPLIQLVIVLSRGGTRKLSLHMFIAVLILAGATMEFLARFMHLGQSNWGYWLSTEYNLNNWVTASSDDQIGWRVLETSHLVTFGTVIWIDSFEYLCLGCALVCIYASVNSLPPGGPMISRALAGFGLFIGLFSMADFVSGVLRLEDWSTFRTLTLLISVINQLILIPIFLLVLGMQLPKAVREHKASEVATNGSVQRSRHWVDAPSSPQASSQVEMVEQHGED